MNITTENLQFLAPLADEKEIFAVHFCLSYNRRVYGFVIVKEGDMNESWGIYLIFSRSRAWENYKI